MVIQRWQTVFLFLAAVMMGVLSFVPWGYVGEAEALNPTAIPAMMVINLLVAVLLVLSIFMFRNLRRQKIVTLLSILLIVVSGVTGLFVVYGNTPAGRMEWAGGIWLLICSLIFAVVAYRRIVADDKLLRSTDRLR